MELLLAVAVIIAISELREWRFNKHISKLCGDIIHQTNTISFLSQQINVLEDELTKKGLLIDDLRSCLTAVVDGTIEIKQIVERAEANTATILKEYELNGIPLGFQRKQPDYVEGL